MIQFSKASRKWQMKKRSWIVCRYGCFALQLNCWCCSPWQSSCSPPPPPAHCPKSSLLLSCNKKMYNIMCHPASNHWCHGKLWQGIDDSTLRGFYAYCTTFESIERENVRKECLSWFLFLLIFPLSITWLFWRNILRWIIYCVGFWFWLPFDTYRASATVLCMMKNL